MDEQTEETKVCPDCGAEYFSHVKECSRCMADLVPSSEMRGGAKSTAKKHPSDGLVCIEDGPL